MWTRLKNLLKGSRPQPLAEPASPLEEALRLANLTWASWWQRLPQRPVLFGQINDLQVESSCARFPNQIIQLKEQAEIIRQHRFDLLGSGSCLYLDDQRPPTSSGYRPIHWFLDPVRQLAFPRGVPHKEWNLFAMRPGNADIKYPWELARCQHWIPLAQAWRLLHDPGMAQEIAHQLLDFVEANPVGYGIHWTCTMDVAIRAHNWAMALNILQWDAGLPEIFWSRALNALFEHGRFIHANLENNYEVTSNHFLSNVVGLYTLSTLFADIPDGQTWNAFCRKALEEEIQKQILPDGADYESSVPYHRLVLELFLGAARLAEHRRQPLSDDYYAVLHRMTSFLFAVLRPDGLMPQIGDADDGRLQIFSQYGLWNPQDARHILAPAALMLHEPAWLPHAGEIGPWEALWWGLDCPDVALSPHPDQTTRLLPDAGLIVSRNQGDYLLISNSIVGTKGFGNHKHNDQLSFEFHLNGQPIVVDPGSFVYTSDFDARNRFRSTAYHNTLMIDGVEQNETNPQWIFRLFESAHAEHLFFSDDPRELHYRGRHSGYSRLENGPVIHERTFVWMPRQQGLLILDQLNGSGNHQLAWHFHLAPGVTPTSLENGRWALRVHGETIAILQAHPSLTPRLVEAQYAPSYGRAFPCMALEFLRPDGAIDPSAPWFFAMGGPRWFESMDAQPLAWDRLQQSLASAQSP